MSKILLATVIALGMLGSQAVAEGMIANDPSIPLPPTSLNGLILFGMTAGPTSLMTGTLVPQNAQYYATHNGRTYLVDEQHRVLRIVR